MPIKRRDKKKIMFRCTYKLKRVELTVRYTLTATNNRRNIFDFDELSM